MRIDIMSPLMGKICPCNTPGNFHVNLHTFLNMYAKLKDESLRYRGCNIRERQTNPSSIPHRPDATHVVNCFCCFF